MFNVLDFFKNKVDDIGEPPWQYDFLLNLDESEYPLYLKKIYKYRTGGDLPLKKVKNEKTGKACYIIDKKKLKTFNEKLQWLKLYDATELKRNLTDKLKVRDFVKEKIGEEYLKPVLQVIPSETKKQEGEELDLKGVKSYFDQIDFEKLPQKCVIKCNHGCKWHFTIRNKEELLKNKRLVEAMRRQMTGWLEQEFWPWEGFEMQYKGIEPKIFIEPYLSDDEKMAPRAIEIFCFNGVPKIYANIEVIGGHRINIYNEDYSYSDLILHPEGKALIQQVPPDEILKKSVELSKELSKGFKFVRVDWMVSGGKLYFEELTFTTYSGFTSFAKDWELKMGSWINLD